MQGEVKSVDVWKLFVDDQKHRMDLDIENLAKSIQATGQINPITVVKVRDEFRVIAGRRRYAALKYIQEELTPDKKVKALVYVTDLDKLQQELIKIDENIMRQNLKGAEFDEAIYRRKQIYEELHPETKQHVAGGATKSGKKKVDSFGKNAAKRLGVTVRTIEKAAARASKASEKVKQAREKGQLSPSKVDLLVTLPIQEQDLLLNFARKNDVADLKKKVVEAKNRGAKAVALDLEEIREEDKRLKPLIKNAKTLYIQLQESMQNKLTLEGDDRHENLRMFDRVAKELDKFTSYQRQMLGYVKAISKRGEERKVIRSRTF